MIPYTILDPNALIYIPYPRVNCLKTIPFTAAHTYLAHIWQYPARGYIKVLFPKRSVKMIDGSQKRNCEDGF